MSAVLIQGWCITQLSDVGEIITGKTPSTKESGNFGGEIPFIKPGDLDIGGYITKTADTLTELGALQVPTIPPNSITVTCIGNLGKIGISSRESATNQQINTVVPSSLVDFRFLYYQIQTLKPWMQENASATTVTIINKGKFSKAPVALPPLAEQKAIAEKLDTLLAQVESTKARLKRIPKILKRFRQSVLAAAVSGKLTEEWRNSNGVVTCWDEVKLADYVHSIEAGKNLKCTEIPPSENEYGIIKISAVTWGVYNEEESKTLPSRDLFTENRRIKVGDLLISRANTIELLGNPVIVKKVSKNLMLSDKVLRLVMDDDDKSWVDIYLKSPRGRKEIQSRATGNQQSMRNIGQKALLDIDIPKLADEEKAEIVRRVDQLFAYADTIETQVNKALERVNDLTQSILAKAFRGELTEQWRKDNPDLISGENSAEALQEKIKAQRDVIRKQTKYKRTGVKKKTGSRMSKLIIKVVDALKEANKPLSGQELLAASGYPSDSSTEKLEQFFLDLREALFVDKSIVKLERGDDGQDWFALAEPVAGE